jgi:hypothetical protein
VRNAKGLGTVRVLLDRRRQLARRKSASFRVRVPANRLRAGTHRLTARASQRGGTKHVKNARFRVCAASAASLAG